jgi:DNA-binding transcriptional LysR family regulator
MERVRHLREFWGWLPAFRVIAETEHLPTAARVLGVTPSALSRAVKELEARLELKLFDRRGRNLVLNSRGVELLASLRDSMRLLESGLTRLTGTSFQGPLLVAAPAPLAATFVVPALADLVRQHPALRPSLASVGAREANDMLLDGRLDLALLDDAVAHPALRFEKVGELSYGVYGRTDHPLGRRRRVEPRHLAEHPFVGPPAGGDHWPVEWPRTVAMQVDQLYLGMEVCANGALLALLPDAVVARSASASRLRRLRLELPAKVPIFLVRRPPHRHDSPIERAAAIVRRVASRSC